MMLEELPLLPLGTSDFVTLRMRGQIYVDKTDLVFRLASQPEKFFLSRPRRFGKSLLVSTFESLFKFGLRDFKDLAIENLWKDKAGYSVVRLDFSEIRHFTTIGQFERRLVSLLARGFGEVGFSFAPSEWFTVHDQLSVWMRKLPPNSLVVLIDEYDAPLTSNLGNAALFEDVRGELSNFYATLKFNDRAIRFLFMTGITKFNKTSIFSELNNLADISFSPQYGTLLGYTENELGQYFGGYLERARQALNVTEESLLESLRVHYDGFCFDEEASTHVYSPWSTLNFFKEPQRKFRNYWFESGGRSRVLTEYFKTRRLKSPLSFDEEKSISLADLTLSSGLEGMSDLTLLTQAGYLTIKKVVDGDTVYLGYPNKEVTQSMAKLYTDMLLNGKTLAQAGAENIAGKMETEPAGAVVQIFSQIFESIDYQNYPVTSEASVRALVQTCLAGAGLEPRAEVHGSRGRSDLEVRTGSRLWVFEFKVQRSGEDAGMLLREALEQIRRRRYGEQNETGELVRAALVFSLEERKFVRWAECPRE